MTYEEFKRELYRNLQQGELSKGKEILLWEKGVIFTDVERAAMLRMINRSEYGREETVVREDILCIKWKKQGAISMLHWKVHSVYETYKKEGWQGVLPQMIAKIQTLDHVSPKIAAEKYETDSDKLIIRPLHYPRCRQELEKGVCWIFGDIALVLYLLIMDEGEDYITVKIQRSMIDKWDVSDEILLTNALLNSYAKMPPRLYYGTDFRADHDRDYGVFMPEERGHGIAVHPEDEWEGRFGYILTTTKRLNGAIALFYPGVKERLAELMGGDYYVGFTSIHEAVIHPACHKGLSEMKDGIQQTNICFEPREMLTNRVYRYSCKRKELIEV